jgi:hypothetical protein
MSHRLIPNEDFRKQEGVVRNEPCYEPSLESCIRKIGVKDRVSLPVIAMYIPYLGTQV